MSILVRVDWVMVGDECFYVSHKGWESPWLTGWCVDSSVRHRASVACFCQAVLPHFPALLPGSLSSGCRSGCLLGAWPGHVLGSTELYEHVVTQAWLWLGWPMWPAFPSRLLTL